MLQTTAPYSTSLTHTPFLFLHSTYSGWFHFSLHAHTPLLSEPPWYPGDSIHPSSLRWRKATPAPPLSVFSLPQLSLDINHMIGLLNGARLETLCALEMFGHVWQFCVFSPPGSEVTTMHNPATWWRRGKRWIKKERDGNKGQFD